MYQILCILTESLDCTWKTGDGKLKPYIASGTPKTVSGESEENCRQQCTEQTAFICAAVNYQSSTNNCELLAENEQTASVESSSGWRYSVRPGCAGK